MGINIKDNPLDISLLETLLWENGRFFLLARHISRLEKSARHFSFPYEIEDILSKLDNTASGLNPGNKYRVRLLLDKKGDISIYSSLLPPLPALPVQIKFSDKKTDKSDIFLAHKTTKREIYDSELAKCRKEGFFEILFTNTSGEVTEGAITNVIIKRGDVYLTPPLSSGVLPGTYREYLFSSLEIPLKEQTLFMDDLLSAKEIFIINSVVKMLPARF